MKNSGRTSRFEETNLGGREEGKGRRNRQNSRVVDDGAEILRRHPSRAGGAEVKDRRKAAGGGGVSMLDGEHGMWEPDEESRATFHKFAGLMEPFDKTPLLEGHGLTGAKKAGAPGLRPGKSR